MGFYPSRAYSIHTVGLYHLYHAGWNDVTVLLQNHPPAKSGMRCMNRVFVLDLLDLFMRCGKDLKFDADASHPQHKILSMRRNCTYIYTDDIRDF